MCYTLKALQHTQNGNNTGISNNEDQIKLIDKQEHLEMDKNRGKITNNVYMCMCLRKSAENKWQINSCTVKQNVFCFSFFFPLRL